MATRLSQEEQDFIIDNMIELGLLTEDEYELVGSINGYNDKTVLDILFVRTGCRNLEQFVNQYDLVTDDEINSIY